MHPLQNDGDYGHILYINTIYLYILYTSRAKRAPVGAWVPCPFQLPLYTGRAPAEHKQIGSVYRFGFYTEIYSPQIALKFQV